MNDYLDNLIAKSLGLTEVVAPRPMSLFEPLPSDAGPFTPDHYLLEQDGASLRTAASVMPAGVMPAGVMPDVVTPPAPTDESSEKPPPPRAAQSDQLSQHPVQSIDRSLSQPTPLLVPYQPLGGDVGQRVDRAERAAPVNQQIVDGHPAASEYTPSHAILQATIPADHQTLATPEASPFTPMHAEASERAMAITPAPPAHTLLIAPALDQERGSQVNRAAAPPAPEASAPAAPTIKITIGRVDVRAVMTERPEPRPAPATRNTALTLEEYLKRRSGGKL